MKKVDGKPRSLRELLSKRKYTVQFYQREYRWQKKQIEELIEDLTGEFWEHYDEKHERSAVAKYGHYFMGSIVLSKDDDETAIIDGQQRLTSFTLLLIYLQHLQESRLEKVQINDLIYSEKFGKISFNIDVPDRNECMICLFENNKSQPKTNIESIRNIIDRYNELDELFPSELKGNALPYFIDWLIENVDFIEIAAETEQDAHKIFVSMNDRGLSLTPIEMLKGYLLSKVDENSERANSEKVWKEIIARLKEHGKDEDSDFIKNWLRAQYAKTIRETKKDAEKQDFDLIGTEFHKWAQENKDLLGLKKSKDYKHFICEIFVKYSEIYMQLLNMERSFNSVYEYVYYNANRDFTFQKQVIMAAINLKDNNATVNRKIKLVSWFLDYYISLRVFNFKTLTYSSVRNYIFNLTKNIRSLNVDDLKKTLLAEINSYEFNLDGIDRFYLNQFTKRYMRHILARITYYIEISSNKNSDFVDYINRNQKNPYDIEHILCDDYDRFKKEFNYNEEDFNKYRNYIGGLLLLPEDKNKSLQDKSYAKKLKVYFGENLLARSLHKECYLNNPRFLRFKKDNDLDFIPYDTFLKTEIDERQALYKQISSLIWNKDIIKSI